MKRNQNLCIKSKTLRENHQQYKNISIEFESNKTNVRIHITDVDKFSFLESGIINHIQSKCLIVLKDYCCVKH